MNGLTKASSWRGLSVALHWMVVSGFSVALASSFVALQLCPAIVLVAGTAEARLSNRTAGAFTGSRSASAAGRIP
eukprot:3868675-Pyramimonas_sp.AAC.1